MNFPGFHAEASLYETKELYLANAVAFGDKGAVKPAWTTHRGFPCERCPELCAGGSYPCHRWCACACRGGTKCPPPD